MEDQLNDFVLIIWRRALEQRRCQEEHARDEEIRRENALRQEHLRKEREIEEAKIKDLEDQTGRFEKVLRIRAFLKALEESGLAYDPGWVEWAHKYADSIDPLKR